MAWGDSIKGWLNSDESGKALLGAVFGGVIGGALLVITPPGAGTPGAVVVQTSNFSLFQLLQGCFSGAVAAVVGVVLLMNVDRRDWLRTFATSIFCGYLWPTILTAGSAFVQALLKR